MRRSRVPVAEKRSTEAKTKYNSSLRKTTSMGPNVTKKNFSVSMVSTRSTTENRAKEGTEGERVEPTIEIELKTPDQSVDEVGKKTTESTPMPNAEEPNPKPMEFSPIDNVEDTTGNTPETVKDESRKRTSFIERLAMMVGMRSRDAAVEATKAEKSKTFRTVSTRTTETDQNEDQKKPGPATDYRTTTDHGTTTLELSDLMAKLDQIDEKLEHSEEDRNVIRKEMRDNKHEYLDNYFHLARATEEKLQQMSDKVDTTDGERDKNIRKDMREMKQRYDAVNSQLGSLETRMDTMSRDQAESSSAIQTKLDAILRNSAPQDRPAAERTQGNRVDFVEPQRNKRQSRPLPVTREAASTAPVGAKAIIKSGKANTTSGPGDSTTQNNVGPDAMTWASTWEKMNRTLEAFATRNTDSSDRGSNRKLFKKPKEFKDDSDGCIDTWVEVMRLQLGSLETRMDTMSRDQAESSSAIQTKLDAILRNSAPQDRPAAERTQGNRVDFVEPQRNKRQSRPLPVTREAASTAPVGAKAIIKSGKANTTSGPGDSTTQKNVGPDAMTWASTWEKMNRTLEAFATRNTDSSDRGSNRKLFKKPKEFKDDSDGCIDTWVEVMRLHLEQDNLNDERQACTAIPSNLEGTALKCVVAKKEEERDTADKIFEILLNRFGSGMKGHQVMMRFEKRRQRTMSR